MKIEVDVFDDLEYCARWFGSADRPAELCPFLMSMRFGTVYSCGLFIDPVSKLHEPILPEGGDAGLLTQCKQCKQARIKTLQKDE